MNNANPPALDPKKADRTLWYKNRPNFPLSELAKYAGQTVAWWPDGSFIFAAGPDMISLNDSLAARGYDPSDFVYDDVPVE
jgi:hypothetical protein